MPPLLEDPLHTARAWRDAGRAVAIATVVETWGSSPRPAGSQLVVADSGEFVGSVSAGCVEAGVIAKSAEVIESGQPALLELGIEDGRAWEVGLSCGGQIAIWIERLDPESPVLDALLSARERGDPVVLATDLESGERELFIPDADNAAASSGDALEAAALSALAERRCRRERIAERDRFLHPFHRGPRLLVLGAVHIAESLLEMARLAGLEVVLIEPRRAFAKRAPFDQTPLLMRWPAEAFNDLGLDADTAVVTLTHDPKLDDPALELALRSPAFYVGALGSRKSHARRCERLLERGLHASALERLHAPVGLAIGARSPAEIAVSILAEIVAVRRGGELGS
jgi:xanthine dehydrogenase accessory factor